MKALTSISPLLFWISAIFLSQSALAASSDPVVYTFDGKQGDHLEITIGSYASQAELNEAADTQSQDIVKFKSESGDTPFVLDLQNAGFFSEATPYPGERPEYARGQFITRAMTTLAHNGIEADRVQNADLSAALPAWKNLYYKNVRMFYVAVKLVTVVGVRYASLLQGGTSLQSAAIQVLPVLAIVTGTTYYNQEISDWTNQQKLSEKARARFQSLAETQKKAANFIFGKLQSVQKKIFSPATISSIQTKIEKMASPDTVKYFSSLWNFGKVELAFNFGILILEMAAKHTVGVPFDYFSFLWLPLTTVSATVFQGSYEAAIYRQYEAKVKENKLNPLELEAYRYPKSVAGSVFTVLLSIYANLVDPVSGNLALAGLLVGAHYLNRSADHILDKVKAAKLRLPLDKVLKDAELLQCDRQFGGDLESETRKQMGPGESQGFYKSKSQTEDTAQSVIARHIERAFYSQAQTLSA